MVQRSDGVKDLEKVLAATIVFWEDQEDFAWYVGVFEDERVYLRLGNFPEELLYSLYLGNDMWMDIMTRPKGWKINEGYPPGIDPKTVRQRPRLDHGEFHPRDFVFPKKHSKVLLLDRVEKLTKNTHQPQPARKPFWCLRHKK